MKTRKQLEYPYEPIATIESLSRALGVPASELQAVAHCADAMYRPAKPIAKSDGSCRQPFDAVPRLKKIQTRIKAVLLDRVIFPDYLTGSLRGKDARANAELHKGAAIVLSEDIEKFFPNTSAEIVCGIWKRFFKFSPQVAEVLTRLTTRYGALPEGAKTSPHLANLVFYRREPALQSALENAGLIYSRYVDDICVSSKEGLSNSVVTTCIAAIYGMMTAHGYRAKRSKHEIRRAQGPMAVTKLLVNARPALPKSERARIRTCVLLLELEVKAGTSSPDDLRQMMARARGRVCRLAQFHPIEGAHLKTRLSDLSEALDGMVDSLSANLRRT